MSERLLYRFRTEPDGSILFLTSTDRFVPVRGRTNFSNLVRDTFSKISEYVLYQNKKISNRYEKKIYIETSCKFYKQVVVIHEH